MKKANPESNAPVMSLYFFLFLFSYFLPPLTAMENEPQTASPTVVPSVDLNRYAGLWYEIARLPNRFQNKCAGGVTAFYEQREDGRIKVINSCLNADGTTRQANGIARVVDTTTHARLQVSFVSLFGFQLFWGDYWIIGLAGDYSWAVVGTPSRNYGWILSRTKTPDDETMAEINTLLREQGYNPEQFIRTIQD